MGYTNLWLLSMCQGSVRNASVRRKSSKRASAMSAKHATHSDQASRVAPRALNPPTPPPCTLVPAITAPTLLGHRLLNVTANVTRQQLRDQYPLRPGDVWVM